MKTASSTSQGRRFAALLDFENLAIAHDRRLPIVETAELLASIAPLLQGMPVRVATGKRLLLPNMCAFNPAWGLRVVGSEPDAADNALIDDAHQFFASGVTDLIVASGDHAFVPLAAFARLHIISHADHLSRKLQMAATTVTYLSNSVTEAINKSEVAS